VCVSGLEDDTHATLAQLLNDVVVPKRSPEHGPEYLTETRLRYFLRAADQFAEPIPPKSTVPFI
jgi:hypothetical protein